MDHTRRENRGDRRAEAQSSVQIFSGLVIKCEFFSQHVYGDISSTMTWPDTTGLFFQFAFLGFQFHSLVHLE